VKDLKTGALLLNADFDDGDLGDWTVVDEGKSMGPSQWSVDNRALLQNSDIHTKPTNRQDIPKLGTYLVHSGPEPGV
jgi:hypothetical protein